MPSSDYQSQLLKNFSIFITAIPSKPTHHHRPILVAPASEASVGAALCFKTDQTEKADKADKAAMPAWQLRQKYNFLSK